MSAPNVIIGSRDVEVVGRLQLATLKMIAKESPQKRSRILLHASNNSPVQEMVICLHKSGYFRTHKHPVGKPESYHIIEGELRVNLYDDDGGLRDWFHLGGLGGNTMYRLAGGIFHEPRAVSEWAIYHEVYTGPYDKNEDVEYADWAPEEV